MARHVALVGKRVSVFENPRSWRTRFMRSAAQETRTDSVKCARPGQRASHEASILAHDLRRNPLDPADHLSRRPAGKRQEQNPAWIGALDNQVGHAMR